MKRLSGAKLTLGQQGNFVLDSRVNSEHFELEASDAGEGATRTDGDVGADIGGAVGGGAVAEEGGVGSECEAPEGQGDCWGRCEGLWPDDSEDVLGCALHGLCVCEVGVH